MSVKHHIRPTARTTPALVDLQVAAVSELSYAALLMASWPLGFMTLLQMVLHLCHNRCAYSWLWVYSHFGRQFCRTRHRFHPLLGLIALARIAGFMFGRDP